MTRYPRSLRSQAVGQVIGALVRGRKLGMTSCTCYVGIVAACCISSAFASPSLPDVPSLPNVPSLPSAAPTSRDSPRLPQMRFVYSTSDSSIADVLTALGRAIRTPVDIEGQLDGRLSGRYDMQAEPFLDMLASSFGFIWYFDGVVIHVDPANERMSSEMQLNYATAKNVKARLEGDGIEDARMPATVDAKRNTLTVSGPPGYVERVSGVVQHFEGDARAQMATVVRAVPLKYENAADRTLVVAGHDVRAAGLASRLQQRVHSGESAAFSEAAGAAPREFTAPLPIFEADARTNSVLVRDRADRINADRELVARFDRKPRVMSIRAYVFDVDAEAFDTLGLNGSDVGDSGTRSGEVVAHDAGAALLERVSTLAESGKARVCIDRSLVTFDHAPVAVDCREVIAIDRNGAGEHQDAGDSQRLAEYGASLVVEPDFSGKGSASLFQLVTTVRNGDDSNMAADYSELGSQPSRLSHGRPAPAAAAARTTLASGDALVLFDTRDDRQRAPDAWRRLIIVVPTPIEG